MVDLAILALVAERARAILFVLPADGTAVARALREGRAEDVLVQLVLSGETAVERVLSAVRTAPADDRPVALEEAVADARKAVLGRLTVLRVLGPAASACGLAGAAVQAAWLREPHGLLDLDPDRLLGMAMSAGAICLTLGVAGSTAALSAVFFLRRRAVAILSGVDRVAGTLRASWTHEPR